MELNSHIHSNKWWGGVIGVIFFWLIWHTWWFGWHILLIEMDQSSLFCVLFGKKYAGLKKVRQRRNRRNWLLWAVRIIRMLILVIIRVMLLVLSTESMEVTILNVMIWQSISLSRYEFSKINAKIDTIQHRDGLTHTNTFCVQLLSPVTAPNLCACQFWPLGPGSTSFIGLWGARQPLVEWGWGFTTWILTWVFIHNPPLDGSCHLGYCWPNTQR